MTMGKIISVNISDRKGVPKSPADRAVMVEGLGIENDAHAAPGDRQVSLLMVESVRKQQKLFSGRPETVHIELTPGIFAENLTTEGIDLLDMEIGTLLRAGGNVRLRLSKIGKECHTKCAIFRKVGDCIMPAEGVFCEVLEGGVIQAGDSIERID
ncbi:MOSC domain-containing protein [Thermodesulfobacteriota bacterium]